MRLTKAEKIILILTVLFVLFAVGYKIVANRSKNEMKISTLPKVEAVQTVQDSRMNVNTAGIDELTTLPGVGELVAGEIISYRDAHGGFTDVDEVSRVPGMNKQLFAMIQDLICTE